MNTNKYKETKQRELILSIMEGTRNHPTADWIYDEARQKIPNISKGTVYRNLAILLERGEISELNLSGTVTRYEIKQPSHYHFRCELCGRVTDVNMPVTEDLNRKAGEETGFKVNYHQLEFRGVCRDCQRMSEKDDPLKVDK